MPVPAIGRKIRNSALCLAIGACFASAAYAQSNTSGSINGQAHSGDVIVVENPATGFSREVAVAGNGAFRVGALPPGAYRVTRRAADGTATVRENISVSTGTGANVNFVATDAATLDRVEVVAAGINPIDVSSVESATILTEAILDAIPVARTVTDVVLLAPGTTVGDAAFGNLASFGGATVGENAYYINGFNVTNFRNGLGGSTVPFEFYREFQVKTGGYGAEFGRSTGGVINAITKRGTNEWEFGANVYFAPKSLQEDGYCVSRPDGTVLTLTCRDTANEIEANFSAAGPIIKDRLFFAGIYNVRNWDETLHAVGTYRDRKNDDPFWGVKLDWQISDDHLLEYTGFRDQRHIVDTTYLYDHEADAIGEHVGATQLRRGGRNDIFRYTGYLGDRFTLSALYGKGEFDRSDIGEGDTCPVILDNRTGTQIRRGCWSNQIPGTAFDTREAYRLDAEWDIGQWLHGNHRLRFGLDQETNTSEDDSFYSGGVLWQYREATRSPTGFEVRQRFLSNGGRFETESRAFYLEDHWDVTDDLLLVLGIRNEQFDNRNALGETFTKQTNQWAPRVGLSWNIGGDSKRKFFANAGRYHLPVAGNTNIRLAGAEFFTEQFFVLDGVNADYTPVLGAALTDLSVFSDGTVKDPRTIVDQNLKPMFQDEFILGYQQEIARGWTAGVRAIRRDLKSTIEDIAIDAALNDYAAANGYDDFHAGGFDYYVLTNPGKAMNIFVDMDGDGVLEELNLSAAQLGYPKSVRKYHALEFTLDRAWDGVWFLQGSYTWSKSYGNNEGYVRSDNGQGDAGLTTLFDQPGLLEGAYGNLPNDRRHQFKLFGAWQFAADWKASGLVNVASGRPKNCFGNHPTDEFAAAYGAESFYCDLSDDGTYNPVLYPRGSLGTTPWTFRLDLGLEYRPQWAGKRLGVKMDVNNIFNSGRVLEVNEVGELGPGDRNPNYGLPTFFQAPRGVRFSVSYDW
ncbi:TonB-dependent receptor [Stenotrophomonas sp. NLF4-10]|uniref:TonB-dependent receptor n=1 Tax=Stenotrophomonas sp. NLF4-10 TaxID=2918754 RepID=UPI001EFA2C90|nr:TonB-dependent receptor [Stenotrophomonas sp. NLF4-10]MCG8274884.1 TonB-dependent receptor [Stenotrophomonas sp. NLF4-10]